MSDFALYTNTKGQPVTHSSYSSRSDFRKCPKYFELTRIQGWSDKEKRAATLFGNCVEAGIQYFEKLNRTKGTAVSKFTELWDAVKTIPEFNELIYSEKEKDWFSLARAGREMMMLYEIRASFLPISVNPAALFAQVLRKKVFPGSQYDKLENKAIFDILSFPRWNHPLLAPYGTFTHCTDCAVRWSCALESDGPQFTPCQQHELRTLIVDVKTSGVDLEESYVKLDPQLAEYAWMARVPDIAFLWFVKKAHEIKKGSRVTLLEPAGKWPAGTELSVLNYDSDTGEAFIGTYVEYAAFDKALTGLRGKAREAMSGACLSAAVVRGDVVRCPASIVTKQRLQFAAARFSQADMDEIGKDVAQTTVEMIRAKDENYYPKLAGIRFPNQKCQFCSMHYICLGDSDGRDANLQRKGDEWLEEAFEIDHE